MNLWFVSTAPAGAIAPVPGFWPVFGRVSLSPQAILCGRRDSNPHPRRDRDLNPQASIRESPPRFEKVLVYWAFVSSGPPPSAFTRVRPWFLVSNWLANWVATSARARAVSLCGRDSAWKADSRYCAGISSRGAGRARLARYLVRSGRRSWPECGCGDDEHAVWSTVCG